MEKAAKKSKRASTLPKWFIPAWSTAGIGIAVVTVLLNYVTYFSTNVLGLPPALVGGLMLVSKVFDGFTDIMAGFFIDRTNTRLGKGRPYDFAIAFFCLLTVVLFAVPAMGQTATAVYVFITYTLVFSVFSTLFSCSAPVYLSRAVTNNDDQVRVLSIAGFLTTVPAIVMAIVMPNIIANIGTDRASWSVMAAVICIPCMLLSMVRFLAIKEKKTAEVGETPKLAVKEGVKLLFNNKYIMIFAATLLLTNIGGGMNQSGIYYFEYIVGDISLYSIAALGSLVAPITLILVPVLSRKIGLANVMRIGLGIGVVGYLLPLVNLRSVPVLLAGALCTGISTFPIYMLAGSVVINCMDYGEWLCDKRGEGIYACIIGFCSKVGLGVAAAVIGGAMSLGGFDSTTAIQSPAANTSITLLYTVIPAIIFVAALVIFTFYNLDKKLPGIREELAARKLTKE